MVRTATASSRRTLNIVCLATILAASGSLTPSWAQGTPGPERWEATIQKFESQDRDSAPAKGGVLFVGSSSIVYWNLEKWFPELGAINRGFGGSTMVDLNHFVDRVVVPYDPRTIVLYSGDNDIAGGTKPSVVVQNYREFFDHVQEALPSTKILVIAVKPSLARWKVWPAMQEVNIGLAKISASEPLLTFVDVADVMLGPDGLPVAELFVKDGLHMSAEGYRRWTRLMEPLLGLDQDAQPASQDADAKAAAMRVLDDFMVAFNARDEAGWTGTMHFPHVRIAGGETRVDANAAAMMASFDFDEFAQRFSWHHSEWLSREVVQAGPDKVHVAVRFGRFRGDGSISAEFDSLYVVVLREGKWGVVGRSSFAP